MNHDENRIRALFFLIQDVCEKATGPHATMQEINTYTDDVLSMGRELDAAVTDWIEKETEPCQENRCDCWPKDSPSESPSESTVLNAMLWTSDLSRFGELMRELSTAASALSAATKELCQIRDK
jgi:hypothetical protein